MAWRLPGRLGPLPDPPPLLLGSAGLMWVALLPLRCLPARLLPSLLPRLLPLVGSLVRRLGSWALLEAWDAAHDGPSGCRGRNPMP